LNLGEKLVRKTILMVVLVAISPLLFPQQALNNDSVIKLVKAGLSDDLIVTTVGASTGSYDISADGIIALKTAGVSDKVVSAIVAKASAPAPVAGTVPVAADPNDPASAHDPGIYLMLNDSDGKPKMVRLVQTESNVDPPMMSLTIKARIPGPHATLRTSESKPVFYMYFPSSSSITDAATPSQFTLLVLTPEKDHRETEVAHLKAAAGVWVMVSGIDTYCVIHSSAEKVRPNVFKVTPDRDMDPGEYGFIATMKLSETGAASFFDFGVDAK